MQERWDCLCGAGGLAGAFCPFCGRRGPSGELPPLPAVVDAWLPPVLPRRVGLTPLTGTLSAVIALLLLAGGSVVAVRSPSPFGVAGPSRGLAEAVERGKRFVADFRGAPFLEDVDVSLLGDEAFVRALNGEADDDPVEDEQDYEATLQGLQLADPGEDVGEREEELLAESVVGFYDDETEELVVRGAEVTPYVELTLVHELAHAWQDQHFDLSAMWEATGSDDEALALRGLIEGDALRVESAWLEAQPEDVREEVEEVEDSYDGDGDGDGDGSAATESLDLFYSLPYGIGYGFVEHLHRDGGNAKVDEAFRDPPTTTAQLFEPSGYRDRAIPADPPDPVPEGRVVDRGTLGQMGLLVFLARGDLSEDDFGAASGWNGDEYVTWQAGGRTCTTVSIVMVDGEERDELAEALRPRGVRVTPVSERALTVVSCAA